jgi:hypothetical protein
MHDISLKYVWGVLHKQDESRHTWMDDDPSLKDMTTCLKKECQVGVMKDACTSHQGDSFSWKNYQPEFGIAGHKGCHVLPHGFTGKSQ